MVNTATLMTFPDQLKKCFRFLALLLISGNLLAQSAPEIKFRLAIIAPDTMIIDDQLLEFARKIESDHTKDYYREVDQNESVLQLWIVKDSLNRFAMMKRAMLKRLDSLKALESEVKQYKYFYKVADYSKYHFQERFGDYGPNTRFIVIATKQPSKKKFRQIAKKFSFDYLVKYTEIVATADQMKLTATLYSKTLKVLFKDEFTATKKCPDERFRCVTPLCCMMINVTTSATGKVLETLAIQKN